MFNVGIFLAAIGITMLELSEASAVAIALYHEQKNANVYMAAALGVIVILVPTTLVGNFISIFPLFYVRIFSATLLLYFGLRLVRSARRAVRYSLLAASGAPQAHHEEPGKRGIVATAFSVGTVEAFEAAIVIVALLPQNFSSALEGVAGGALVVLLASYALRMRVRKIKQANMKVAVSALLLTFAFFWYAESVFVLDDLVLIPVFILCLLAVYFVSHRGHSLPAAVGNA